MVKYLICFVGHDLSSLCVFASFSPLSPGMFSPDCSRQQGPTLPSRLCSNLISSIKPPLLDQPTLPLLSGLLSWCHPFWGQIPSHFPSFPLSYSSVHGAIWSHYQLLYGLQATNGYYIFKLLKKSKEEEYLLQGKIIWNSNSMSINQILFCQ